MNRLTEFHYNGGWERLIQLSLDNNQLSDWSNVHEFSLFPAGIQEIRLGGNPALQGDYNVSMFRFQVIARIPTLKLINGSIIRPQEKIDAERLYLRTFMNDETEVNRSLWQSLVLKHGDPRDIGAFVSQKDALAQQTLSNNQVEILLRSLTSTSAGMEMRKKLLITMNIGALKALCSRLFKVSIGEFQLYYHESRDVIMPELMDDDLKDLSYYMLKDGGEIWVEDYKPSN